MARIVSTGIPMSYMSRQGPQLRFSVSWKSHAYQGTMLILDCQYEQAAIERAVLPSMNTPVLELCR